MRIRYTIPFDRKIIVDDYWEIPIQNGKLKIIEEGGYAKGFEVIFENQPLNLAPHFQPPKDGGIPNITSRDNLLPTIKKQLDNAASFLECMFDINLTTDNADAKYEGETPEEENLISVKGLSIGKHEPVLPLPFSMITRAIMAAEDGKAPKFEATLVTSARQALSSREFINSFRYSFLLIESLYGKGQFKKDGLKAALKSDQEFVDIVDFSVKDMLPAQNDYDSDTAKLLKSKPAANAVIEHIVEKRGFYFHGNVKRKDAWKPDEQAPAETLALLAIAISSQISMKAADRMFAQDLEKRHFEDAMRAGAKIVFEINYKFKEPDENFTRQSQFKITSPGTKVTPRSAFEIAKYFLDTFQDNQPASSLIKAECLVQETGQKVFDLTFHGNDEA